MVPILDVAPALAFTVRLASALTTVRYHLENLACGKSLSPYEQRATAEAIERLALLLDPAPAGIMQGALRYAAPVPQEVAS